jgi:predicted RecB family nuclease
LKYQDAVDPKKSPSEQQEAKDWLFSYNLDDVRATFAVRDYLRNLTF